MSNRLQQNTDASPHNSQRMLLAAGIFALASLIFCTSAGLLAGFLVGRETMPSRAPMLEYTYTPPVSTSPAAGATPEPSASRPTATPDLPSTSSRPTVTATPTLPPFDPVAPGEEGWANGMAMRVEGLTRPADAIVKRGSTLNPSPDPGQEYIFVELAITCERSEGETCLYSPLINFKLLGEEMRYTPQIFLTNVPGLLEGGELAASERVSGDLVFVIDQDETDLVLMYQNILATERAFLAVP